MGKKKKLLMGRSITGAARIPKMDLVQAGVTTSARIARISPCIFLDSNLVTIDQLTGAIISNTIMSPLMQKCCSLSKKLRIPFHRKVKKKKKKIVHGKYLLAFPKRLLIFSAVMLSNWSAAVACGITLRDRSRFDVLKISRSALPCVVRTNPCYQFRLFYQGIGPMPHSTSYHLRAHYRRALQRERINHFLPSLQNSLSDQQHLQQMYASFEKMRCKIRRKAIIQEIEFSLKSVESLKFHSVSLSANEDDKTINPTAHYTVEQAKKVQAILERYKLDSSEGYDVLIDSGASTWLTDDINDFVEPPTMLGAPKGVDGIGKGLIVKGKGRARMKLIDVNNKSLIVESPNVLYCPQSPIKIISPQALFQCLGKGVGEMILNEDGVIIKLGNQQRALRIKAGESLGMPRVCVGCVVAGRQKASKMAAPFSSWSFSWSFI
mmetsp:Transcript_31542/g.45951  ORF Transcript_31542/g.45951 Transcript_31542/m.45951 type:complete len:435 (+) Transcript_31542:3617-4921(+)